MARKNAETNSVSRSERAVALMLMLIATSFRRDPRELQHARHDNYHCKRQRQEHLPAKPHQLVVAVAWDDGLGHREQEEHEKQLEAEPDDAERRPIQGKDVDRRRPAAEEQDR